MSPRRRPCRRGGARPGAARLGVLLGAWLWAAAGCGWFGPSEPAPDPFAGGTLNGVAHLAPAGSESAFLARLADDMGWEEAVARDALLRESAREGAFADKVRSRLLGLFFRQGFSVLPTLGEGHEFTRDTLVRGKVADSRYLVRTREAIRIIFVELAQNVVIIYPKDGTEPQVFTRRPESSVALRASRLELYLN